jgi:hypothetical protein
MYKFNQSVRVRSIAIQCSVPGQAPKGITLLINRPSVGFEDVEDAVEPDVTQILELSEVDVREGKHVPLRYVRFQSVNSLHVCLFLPRWFVSLVDCHTRQIFVSSNHGGEDETRIDSLDILGIPLQ